MLFKSSIFGAILFAASTTLVYADTTEKTACHDRDTTKIEKAIDAYLVKNSSFKLSQFNIIDKRCVNDYALFRIHPKKEQVDDAFIFLNKKDDKWQVMSMGTDFEKSFLEKLPVELQNYSTLQK